MDANSGAVVSVETRFNIESKVASRSYNLGLISLPVENSIIPLKTVPILKARIGVVVPRDHRLAQRATVAASDLMHEPLIGLKPGQRWRDRADEYLGRTGTLPKFWIETNATPLAISMVREGLGISVIDRICAALLPKDDMAVFRPLEERTLDHLRELHPQGVHMALPSGFSTPWRHPSRPGAPPIRPARGISSCFKEWWVQAPARTFAGGRPRRAAHFGGFVARCERFRRDRWSDRAGRAHRRRSTDHQAGKCGHALDDSRRGRHRASQDVCAGHRCALRWPRSGCQPHHQALRCGMRTDRTRFFAIAIRAGEQQPCTDPRSCVQASRPAGQARSSMRTIRVSWRRIALVDGQRTLHCGAPPSRAGRRPMAMTRTTSLGLTLCGIVDEPHYNRHPASLPLHRSPRSSTCKARLRSAPPLVAIRAMWTM